MQNKAPLALIELTVMILIFSVAAALCLQAFAWSDLTSAQIQKQDKAMLQAETAAEVVKGCGGDFAEAAELLYGQCLDGVDGLTVYFDRDWLPADGEDSAYRLDAVRKESGNVMLGEAEITLWDQEGTCMFQLPVCWQEVKTDGE